MLNHLVLNFLRYLIKKNYRQLIDSWILGIKKPFPLKSDTIILNNTTSITYCKKWQ